jgi:U4/U6 small nuclear ribonucleoprotein SNU13
MTKKNPKAFPFADRELTLQIMDIIEIAKIQNHLKKGANEVTKTINRGYAEIAIIAADSDPIEIILHLPLLCEDKNVPYIFVGNKQVLGKACGLSRSVIACCISRGGDSAYNEQLRNLTNKIEKFLN